MKQIPYCYIFLKGEHRGSFQSANVGNILKSGVHKLWCMSKAPWKVLKAPMRATLHLLSQKICSEVQESSPGDSMHDAQLSLRAVPTEMFMMSSVDLPTREDLSGPIHSLSATWWPLVPTQPPLRVLSDTEQMSTNKALKPGDFSLEGVFL